MNSRRFDACQSLILTLLEAIVERGILLFILLFFHASLFAGDHERMMDEYLNQKPPVSISIAVLVYPGVVLQDMAGPMEVFAKAQKLTKGQYRTFTVAATLDDLKTEQDLLTFKPDYDFNTMPDADYLIIPGASMPVMHHLSQQELYRTFIERWYEQQQDRHIVSVCTGAYLLAETGLLNGKRATTHFFVADDFEQYYPNIKLVRDVRFVDDGRLMTSSGITSGIDAALHIIDEHSGRRMRTMIANAMQYRFHREEDWPVAPMGMAYQREK